MSLAILSLGVPSSFSCFPVQPIHQCPAIMHFSEDSQACSKCTGNESSPWLWPAESLFKCRVCITSIIIIWHFLNYHIWQTIHKINTEEEIQLVNMKNSPWNKTERLLRGTSRTVMSIRYVLKINKIIDLIHFIYQYKQVEKLSEETQPLIWISSMISSIWWKKWQNPFA